ncbi:MAG: bifunctional folylpolyglutamate synthase/dihydrofolate synthase [Planctomycetes bacterium]|nr:bifunctional folylpolyglutamate synthase/dihydrofolate synthase [Planctomycetota bacterium]
MSTRFATYEAALKYLTESTDYERMRRVRYNSDTFDLTRIAALVEAVGHPERQFRSIHVAGTKGKGSTAAMIEAVLRGHGLRTGLFTSPHLVDLRERIQIDRRLVDPDLMRRMVGRVAEAIDHGLGAAMPTFFEMMTAAGFLCFAEAGVDVAVVETGLGGRLDSTNILLPQVAVITSISIDHTFQLGTDLASIAREKAGIIKPRVPLVLAPQQGAAEQVILATAARLQAPTVCVGRDVQCDWQKAFLADQPSSRVTVRTAARTYVSLDVPLGGRVQADNAACAIAAAEIVLGKAADAEKVREALAAMRWDGRMQVVHLSAPRCPDNVTVIVDGAHNADSLRQLLLAVKDYYGDRPAACLFAAASDKDIPGMMTVLAESGLDVVFTKTSNPRAAEPNDLAEQLRAAGGRPTDTAPHWPEALSLACAPLGDGGVVVICGSLYLVGDVLSAASPSATA